MYETRNSLVVQCLGLRTSTTGVMGQSLVRELRSCMPGGADKEIKCTKPLKRQKNCHLRGNLKYFRWVISTVTQCLLVPKQVTIISCCWLLANLSTLSYQKTRSSRTALACSLSSAMVTSLTTIAPLEKWLDWHRHGLRMEERKDLGVFSINNNTMFGEMFIGHGRDLCSQIVFSLKVMIYTTGS